MSRTAPVARSRALRCAIMSAVALRRRLLNAAIAVAAVSGLAIGDGSQAPAPPPAAPPPAIDPKGAAVEQTAPGSKAAAELVDSFDGLGFGFEGPQGQFTGGSPSDSSLAAGPDHIVQIVNSRLAIFTKKGSKYDTTGRV